MICISESTRILDNYYFVNENANENTVIDSILENTNVIDNYRFLNEGSVISSIIEGIKKIFRIIKEKLQNVWKIITEALTKIKNKIHKKKDSNDDKKNIDNMTEEEKEELNKKVRENEELSEILLDLDKINKNKDILSKIKNEIKTFDKNTKSIDSFNSKEEYIEYCKNKFYDLIRKSFGNIDVSDANSMAENVKKYIKDNFRIVDDNKKILDKYKSKKTFKSIDELQKYKDDLVDIIDNYNKELEDFMDTVNTFIKTGNEFIVSVANECDKNNMDEQSTKKATSDATKACNQTINATSDIGKIATENVVVLGKVSEKIDAETEKMMKFKSDVANANTVEELKKLFPNTEWDENINNKTFANSLSKEQMIKLIKAVNFTIEEFICLRAGWKRGFANTMTIDRNVISKAYQGTARKAEDKFAKLSRELGQIIFYVAIRSDNISDYFKEYYDKIIIKNSNTSKKIDDEATIENIKKWFKEGHADYSKLVVYYARLMITKCLDHDLFDGFSGLDPSLYRSLFNSREYVEHLCSNYTSLSSLSSTMLENKLFDALPKIYPNIKKDSKNIYLKAKKKYINDINNNYDDEDAKEEIEHIKKKEKKYLGYIVESYSIDNIDNIFSEISFI